MLRALCLLYVLYGVTVNGYTRSAPTELYPASSPGYCPLSTIENPGTSISNAYTSNQFCGNQGQILISWYGAADEYDQLDAYMYCCTSLYGFYGYTAYYYSIGSSSRIVGLTLYPVTAVIL